MSFHKQWPWQHRSHLDRLVSVSMKQNEQSMTDSYKNYISLHGIGFVFFPKSWLIRYVASFNHDWFTSFSLNPWANELKHLPPWWSLPRNTLTIGLHNIAIWLYNLINLRHSSTPYTRWTSTFHPGKSTSHYNRIKIYQADFHHQGLQAKAQILASAHQEVPMASHHPLQSLFDKFSAIRGQIRKNHPDFKKIDVSFLYCVNMSFSNISISPTWILLKKTPLMRS